jgi:hypothetical protein
MPNIIILAQIYLVTPPILLLAHILLDGIRREKTRASRFINILIPKYKWENLRELSQPQERFALQFKRN